MRPVRRAEPDQAQARTPDNSPKTSEAEIGATQRSRRFVPRAARSLQFLCYDLSRASATDALGVSSRGQTMSAIGPSRHVALRSLTVAFGAKRKWRYHHSHAPFPAALDDRREQRRVLHREGRHRAAAWLFLFRGRARSKISGQDAHQGFERFPLGSASV